MFFVDSVILLAALLVLVAVLLRRVTARFGVPVLVLFLFVGMLAGSEGIGGIAFDNYELAHGIGTFALAVILFVGGLTTPTSTLKQAWKPALTLATFGVLITAGLTALVAVYVVGLNVLEGMLLGSIVASTDAAAVFSILRTQKAGLDPRLQATVEVESGSNDPMAVFLTVALIGVITGEGASGYGLVLFLVLQMGLGLVVGWLIGKATAWLVNRINLDAAGLYPVLVLTLGLVSYGLAVYVGGSGFLSIYVCGIVVGNSHIVFHRGTLLFHDGIAWISQITMFIVLGLVSFPSQIYAFMWQGLAVAAMLIFIARPIAVGLLLWPFRFTWREIVFTSWAGIKGAVPIVLATYPLLMGIENALPYFNAVFFVVLVSALLQGWSLPLVGRWLKLDRPLPPEPPATLDIISLHQLDSEILDFLVSDDSAVAHMRINELELPEDIVIAMIVRGRDIIPSRGPTVVLPGDHVYVICRRDQHEEIETIFHRKRGIGLPLRAGVLLPETCPLGLLTDLYGVDLPGEPDHTIAGFMREMSHEPLREGTFVELEGWRLFVQTRDDQGRLVIGIEPIASAH